MIVIQHDAIKGDFFVKFPKPCAEKDIVKGCGFKFDGEEKAWRTGRADVVSSLLSRTGVTISVSEEAKAKLGGVIETAKVEQEKAIANIEASRADFADIDIPRGAGAIALGHDFLPYQKAGIAYAAGKTGVLIADEMGLGKTPQSVGIANLDPDCRSVLVVCPASLKRNWVREWTKWDVKGLTVAIVESSKPWPTADVVIINYDILHKFRADIDARKWDLLVADECHLAKNPKSRRTQALLGKKARKAEEVVEPIQARRTVFLTGTPILNRPVEIFPLLERLDPEGLGANFFKFAHHYCDAKHNGFGYDFGGASNLEELQTRLRSSIMVRRLKADVLTDLPPKRRQLIELDRTETRDLKKAIDALEKEDARAEKEIAKLAAAAEIAKKNGDAAYKEAAAKLKEARSVAFAEMAKVRHDLAMAKAPIAAERLDELLAEDESLKVVVMAHHADVVDLLREALGKYGIAEVTGKTPVDARQGECDRFQNDPKCRVFLGTIKAAGVGLTLTAARLVAFVELDWVPGNISQSEDRLHRIGQLDSVLVWHFVVGESLDSRMVQMLVAKQEIADKALNDNVPVLEQDNVEIDLDAFETISDADIAAAEALIAADAAERERLVAEGCDDLEKARRVERAREKILRRCATSGIGLEDLVAEGSAMTRAQALECFNGVKLLAAADSDFANENNGAGFGKADVYLGHALARMAFEQLVAADLGMCRRLANKYRGQLGLAQEFFELSKAA